MNISKLRSALLWFTASLLYAQPPQAAELVEKALRTPHDDKAVSAAIGALNSDARAGVLPDPRVIPAYRELFQKITEKGRRQGLAVAMINYGVHDDVYFDDLMKYAREAVMSSAPLPSLVDEQGRELNQLNPAFARWCESNGLALDPCLMMVYAYPLDVGMLGMVKDRRAVPLFRQGLNSSNYVIVSSAVLGLAKLNDTDSIPLVAAAIQRFPPRAAQSVAARLEEFNDARIAPLLDRFVIDPKWRQEIDEAVRKRRALK